MPTCLLCCICASLPIVFLVYLGIYSFNNPDSEAWLGTGVDGKHALFATETKGMTAKATDMVDIHARFIIWFTWGFMQSLVAPLASVIIIGLGSIIHPSLGACCSGLLGCGMSCGGLAWWITGIVWRFRSDGSYATGDIVPEGKSIDEWETEISIDGSLFQW